MLKILITLTLTALLSLAATTDTELEKLKELHKNHEVKKAYAWKGWQEKPVLERIGKAPENVIEYIGMDNKIYGYEGVPKAAKLDVDFNNDFITAVQELPKQVQAQLKENLIGVFFVTDLGSTGFSEHVYQDGEYYGGWILFDQGLLSDITANEWASWRVNTAFQKSDDYTLSLTIEEQGHNSRKQAIQFILLHEIGHIVGSATQAHPKPHHWKDDPKKFPYSKMSWNSFTESIYDAQFKRRKDFKLYRFEKAALNLSEASGMMEELAKTDFCSLYASNTFFEDYAEAYTLYVHTVMMEKPYALILEKEGKVIRAFENPFISKIMREKRDYFDALMGI